LIKVRPVASGASEEFHWVPSPFTGEPVLVTTTIGVAHGTFKSASRSSAGTTIITDPEGGGRILLTDLLVSTDKTTNSDVTIRFTDGTNTINVMVVDSANAPAAFGLGFTGNWEGWKDARLEMVTTGNVTSTVAVGYVRLSTGLTFAAWDALR